jgi:hypothetical protein
MAGCGKGSGEMDTFSQPPVCHAHPLSCLPSPPLPSAPQVQAYNKEKAARDKAEAEAATAEAAEAEAASAEAGQASGGSLVIKGNEEADQASTSTGSGLRESGSPSPPGTARHRPAPPGTAIGASTSGLRSSAEAGPGASGEPAFHRSGLAVEMAAVEK